MGYPGGSDGKESACNAGHPGSIPALGRSPGEGNGNPLQYSCPENSMDRGVWPATVHGLAELGTTEQMTPCIYICIYIYIHISVYIHTHTHTHTHTFILLVLFL